MLVELSYHLLKRLYSNVLFRCEEAGKTVYLTFDDGPIPEVTPWVLDTLRLYGVQATFFCVGDNVRKYPEVYRQILAEGHSVGNHTFNHVRGFWTPKERYAANIEKAAEYINSDLFRPPHGIICKGQKKELEKRYRIVMSEVVTRDYNPRLRPEKVLDTVKRNTRAGSIIVFHDSLKAERNIRYALPRAIEFLQSEGYEFRKL